MSGRGWDLQVCRFVSVMVGLKPMRRLAATMKSSKRSGKEVQEEVDMSTPVEVHVGVFGVDVRDLRMKVRCSNEE